MNLLHSYHMLSFVKSDMREVEWRVHFFDKVLEEKLPLVYQHFKALDLSSEIYIIKWMLTLFTNSLPLSTSSRLWDNFLLEGEIYVFKASIALIQYFQLELKMSTFDEAVTLLTQMPDVNEDFFFILIDQVKINQQEYVKFIEHQKIA